MKLYRYTGVFKRADGNTYELTVHANGFIQAFILLTAEAIQSGRHYQLETITDDDGAVRHVESIMSISKLLY